MVQCIFFTVNLNFYNFCYFNILKWFHFCSNLQIVFLKKSPTLDTSLFSKAFMNYNYLSLDGALSCSKVCVCVWGGGGGDTRG